MVGARKTRVCHVHGRGRDPGEAQRSCGTLDLARQRMGFVRDLRALAAGGNVDEDAAVLDLHGKRGNAVLLEPGFADAATAVKLPIVPGADDEFAVQPALAKRPADMVARIRYGAEFPVLERYRELLVHRGDTLERRRGKLFGGTNIDPVITFGHDDPVPSCFGLRPSLPFRQTSP